MDPQEELLLSNVRIEGHLLTVIDLLEDIEQLLLVVSQNLVTLCSFFIIVYVIERFVFRPLFHASLQGVVKNV